MDERQRLFFGINDMTAWKLSSICILKLLINYKNKGPLYGSFIQKELLSIFNNVWTPGNDLLYTILNAYEEYGYLKSHWKKDTDQNKRYIRRYSITDEGISHFNSKKEGLCSQLEMMINILEKSVNILWNEPETISDIQNIKISSSVFTEVNLMHYLSMHPNLYGKKIKEELSFLYNHHWHPSDGVLYPLLSRLEKQGFIISDWQSSDSIKKKTKREYRLTNSGLKYLDHLLHESQLQPKIKDLIKLSRNAYLLLQ